MSVTNSIAAKKWAASMKKVQRYGYLTLAVLVTLGLSYYFYSVLHRPVAGVLFFIGGGLVFFYYWIKWFVNPQSPDQDFNPGLNACPDYLSVIPSNSGLYTPTSNSQYLCVDYVGVSRNGGLKKMDPSKIANNINDPAYVFSVDPLVDFTDSRGKAAFVKRLTDAGLSYNSVGDSSFPTKPTNSNNSPVFTG